MMGFGKVLTMVRSWLGLPASEPKQALTLRDYFAARALTGLVGNNMLRCERGLIPVEECAEIAERCYSLADAMIAARTQEGGGK